MDRKYHEDGFEMSEAEMNFACAIEAEGTDAIEESEKLFSDRNEKTCGICFYGKKADKTAEEYAAMTEDEKIEYILVKYSPLCRSIAKRYNYEGADFQDMYMEACVQILEVISQYGINNEQLAYYIWSRVKRNCTRKGKKMCKENDHISLDDECMAEEIEISTAKTDDEIRELELFAEIASILTERQMKITCLLYHDPKMSQASVGKEIGASQQTVSRELVAIREKLEPFRKKWRKLQ